MRRIILLLLMATGAVQFLPKRVSRSTALPISDTGSSRFYATIYKDGTNPLNDATLVIREGNIEAVGNNVTIPKDAVLIDCSGKSIYPSFIDIYSDYGMPALPPVTRGFNFFGPAQINSNQKGAYGWNQALRADVDASKIFAADDAKAKPLRDAGFGAVLSHQKDGIARGTGVVVRQKTKKENLVMIRERASAHYSFSKGSSTQSTQPR
jgi:hypothetical protein